MDQSAIKKMYGINFIGVDETETIHQKAGIISPRTLKSIPEIPFDQLTLEKYSSTHILFLAINENISHQPVTINSLRNYFGYDPQKAEPCFYNQDWYVKEKFAEQSFAAGWYLISANITEDSRGASLNRIENFNEGQNHLPTAVLLSYLFFIYYFHTGGEILFKHDYSWCSDADSNNDRIYVGKYIDPLGINKNGFEIHRYLSVKNNYGVAPMIS